MTTPPSISVNYEQKGISAKPNELGMRPMQAVGYVYVLRSKSENPFIAENRKAQCSGEWLKHHA